MQQVGTSEALNRTADHEGQDQFPKFSPDGTQIAFWSDRDGEGFYVMPALAGAPRKIATGRRTGPPQWSPDGGALGYIAYSAHSIRGGVTPNRRPLSQPWFMSASGENPRPASDGPGQSVYWSPDGQSVFFKGIGPREGSLWQHSVTAGEERKVADLLGRRGRLGRGLSTDGDHLYFTWEEDLGDIWVMDIVTDERK